MVKELEGLIIHNQNKTKKINWEKLKELKDWNNSLYDRALNFLKKENILTDSKENCYALLGKVKELNIYGYMALTSSSGIIFNFAEGKYAKDYVKMIYKNCKSIKLIKLIKEKIN